MSNVDHLDEARACIEFASKSGSNASAIAGVAHAGIAIASSLATIASSLQQIAGALRKDDSA